MLKVKQGRGFPRLFALKGPLVLGFVENRYAGHSRAGRMALPPLKKKD
jgi:hypothetical protein